jgi:hypothetical protein
MHKVAKSPIALAGILLIAAGTSVPAAEPVGPRLAPKLRDALRQEMAQVLVASQDIVAALAIGDHATIAELARQIHDSFILEQSLTQQDREDLEAALPPEFIELDRCYPIENCSRDARSRPGQRTPRRARAGSAAWRGAHPPDARSRASCCFAAGASARHC